MLTCRMSLTAAPSRDWEKIVATESLGVEIPPLGMIFEV